MFVLIVLKYLKIATLKLLKSLKTIKQVAKEKNISKKEALEEDYAEDPKETHNSYYRRFDSEGKEIFTEDDLETFRRRKIQKERTERPLLQDLP